MNRFFFTVLLCLFVKFPSLLFYSFLSHGLVIRIKTRFFISVIRCKIIFSTTKLQNVHVIAFHQSGVYKNKTTDGGLSHFIFYLLILVH